MSAPDRDPAELPAHRVGARRAELVALASRMFRRSGYHGVGMRAIAEAADMQAASLYHHFRSKEELLLESIAVIGPAHYADQFAILDGPGRHDHRLGRMVREHIRHLVVHRDAWWMATRELRALSPDNAADVLIARRRYRNRVAAHLADGVRHGVFHCPDPMLAARALLDMISGINEWFDPAGPITVEQLADTYVDMVQRQFRR